jgi:hypothetical protein
MMLGAAMLLAACSGKTLVKSDLDIKDAPDWVNKGTAPLEDRGGRLIHGVGMAPAMGDQSLQISTADDRARAEVARVLSTYMDVASSDYASATNNADNEQAIARQIKSTTKVVLSGARIIAHWRDKPTGNIYALAELDMKQVQDTLKTVEGLNEDMRIYLEQHGDNIFDSMRKAK